MVQLHLAGALALWYWRLYRSCHALGALRWVMGSKQACPPTAVPFEWQLALVPVRTVIMAPPLTKRGALGIFARSWRSASANTTVLRLHLQLERLSPFCRPRGSCLGKKVQAVFPI